MTQWTGPPLGAEIQTRDRLSGEPNSKRTSKLSLDLRAGFAGFMLPSTNNPNWLRASVSDLGGGGCQRRRPPSVLLGVGGCARGDDVRHCVPHAARTPYRQKGPTGRRALRPPSRWVAVARNEYATTIFNARPTRKMPGPASCPRVRTGKGTWLSLTRDWVAALAAVQRVGNGRESRRPVG